MIQPKNADWEGKTLGKHRGRTVQDDYASKNLAKWKGKGKNLAKSDLF